MLGEIRQVLEEVVQILTNIRGIGILEKQKLNRFPTERDTFDMCVSFVNKQIFFCVKVDGQWYYVPLAKLYGGGR